MVIAMEAESHGGSQKGYKCLKESLPFSNVLKR